MNDKQQPKIIESLDKIIEKDDKLPYDVLYQRYRVQELITQNLRDCIDKNLIVPIIGEGYYNGGMDCYTCDELMTQHILNHYKEQRTNSCILGVIAALSVMINIIFIFGLFI